MAAAATISLADIVDWASRSDTPLRDLDLREPMQQIESLMVERTEENFAGSHAPDGTPWAPLAASTVKRSGDRPPLEGMADSIQSATTDDAVTVWIEHDKAEFHQYGTSRIPARPMVGTTPEQDEEYADIAAEAVMAKLEEYGNAIVKAAERSAVE